MTRFFRVTTTWRSTHVVEINDDALEGEPLVGAILEQTDSSTAELVDWDHEELLT